MSFNNMEKIKVEQLKPYEKNAKKHDKKQIELIANSIKQFGFDSPIIVDKDNVIIAGHGRLEGAKLLGLDEVPVIRKENLTEEQVKAYRLADNKIAESEWDMGLAIEELKGLSDEMFDLTGFDKDLIIEPDDKDDEVPEVPEEPKSKVGDLYELGNHRVLCGDSTKEEDVERLMDGKKADMVFTDPPYGISYEGGMKKWKMLKNDDNLDFLPLFIDRMVESCKKGIATYICFNDRAIPDIMSVLNPRYELNKLLIWVKNNASFQISAHYKQRHEIILYLKQKGQKMNWQGNNKQDTIWEFKRPSKNEYHSTQKPVELIIKAVVNSSNENDLILDMFLGSGSTLIACEKTNRICYGMELDCRYVDTTVERWCRYTGITDIKKNGKEYKWELQDKK